MSLESQFSKKNMAIIQFCFKINYHALYDEQMVIVGDNQQFGNWDVNNGIKLAWSQVKRKKN